MCEGEGEACNNLHHSAERNLSISFTTKGERNSGFAGECGERERGRSECKAFLWKKGKMVDQLSQTTR